MSVKERREQEISETKRHGWEPLGPTEEQPVPDWIDLPDRFNMSSSEGEYTIIHGDTFVYKAISGGGGGAKVFRKLKSDYHDTDRNEGTCPNCQAYVRRMDGDYFLTCHRCGWQYKPLSQRIRYRIARLLGVAD